MPPRGVVFNDLALWGAAFNSVARKANRLGAEATAAEAIRSITSDPKSGVTYTSGPQPLPHQASAPGESPANWTGKLVESIRVGTATPEEAVVEAGGPEAPYAADLEFGTRHMAPRPFMEPAAHVGAAARDAYLDEIRARLNRPGREVPDVG